MGASACAGQSVGHACEERLLGAQESASRPLARCVLAVGLNSSDQED